MVPFLSVPRTRRRAARVALVGVFVALVSPVGAALAVGVVDPTFTGTVDTTSVFSPAPAPAAPVSSLPVVPEDAVPAPRPITPTPTPGSGLPPGLVASGPDLPGDGEGGDGVPVVPRDPLDAVAAPATTSLDLGSRRVLVQVREQADGPRYRLAGGQASPADGWLTLGTLRAVLGVAPSGTGASATSEPSGSGGGDDPARETAPAPATTPASATGTEPTTGEQHETGEQP